MNLKDRYAIVGIGYTPQGRIADRTALSFYLEACANAIMDAGLERKDIDGLMCYRQFPLKKIFRISRRSSSWRKGRIS